MSQQHTTFVVVDCEAIGPSPATGQLTEFGAVDVATDSWFHGRLLASEPSRLNPAVPVLVDYDGFSPSVRWTSESSVGIEAELTAEQVFRRFARWLDVVSGGGRVVFVSDNPAYDFMWIACGFDAVSLPNPFGHSGRRIGDLAAGLSGRWRDTQSWKKLRVTEHDHNPVNDARGNAEALRALLDQHGQPPP